MEIARTCFLEQGPAISTTVIAEAVGLSQGALFKRFGSKRALMLAALLPDMRPLMAAFERGPDERPLEAQLLELAHEIGAHSRQLFPRMTALKAAGITVDKGEEQVRTPILATLKALEAWFERAQQRGLVQPLGSPGDLAVAFFGAIHTKGFVSHLAGTERGDLQSFAQDLAAIWARGLACQGAQR
ncbi:MAG: TetR/AcrR family transcriptional regulator [Deltaproteobacteria bacterium]|nr:TetR/AcrR family transcriptional regulator [Deltaproteobacteria bacterium]